MDIRKVKKLIELLDESGYLMRTTAVYGSGKFGALDRRFIADRPELSAPFQVEMLSVWLEVVTPLEVPFETYKTLALNENGILSELYVERARQRGTVGNVYKGKVLRVLPGMQAAFVDIGEEKAAFLYAGDIAPPDKDAATSTAALWRRCRAAPSCSTADRSCTAAAPTAPSARDSA